MASVIKNPPVNAGDSGDVSSIPGSRKSPGEGNGNPLQYSCLENPRDGGAWWAAIYGVAQSRTRLKQLSSSSSSKLILWVSQVVKNPPANARDLRDEVQSLGQEDPLEKGTATHSSILAWRIPWTEEPGRLQSVGS